MIISKMKRTPVQHVRYNQVYNLYTIWYSLYRIGYELLTISSISLSPDIYRLGADTMTTSLSTSPIQDLEITLPNSDQVMSGNVLG